MTVVDASTFVRRFGQYREQAQREPVAVAVHDRVSGYFVSKHVYDDYQRLRAREAEALAVEEFDDEMLAALASAKMDPRHEHLNALMD